MTETVVIDTEEQLVVSRSEYEETKASVADLKFQLDQLKRLIYGSKSERFIPAGDPQQQSLFQMEATEEPETQDVSYSRKKPSKDKKVPVRMPISPDLPRIEEVIEPESIPEGAECIGEEVTEVLECTPAKIFVRRIVRPKYASPAGVTVADLPDLPFPKSNLGPSLAAYLAVSKFADHLPFYRLRRMLARSGLEVKESTIGGWFMSISELISPLLDVLREEILRQDYLQVDESPIPVQDRNKKGALHTGYHWVTHAPVLHAVLFQYHRGRSADFPKKFLKTFSGALQTDGYAGYNSTAQREDITPLACMAHARRKFEQAQDNDRVRATKALESIGALYDIERRCTDQEVSAEQRTEQRRLHALPILARMEEWMKEEILLVAPKSPIGKALAYALGLWPRLTAYTLSGDYLIDNNLVENTIRPMAIGRKNYMFAGSHRGAENAALMYSLLGTCKLHDIEPLTYFTDLISRIAQHKASNLSELLPYNWKPLPTSE